MKISVIGVTNRSGAVPFYSEQLAKQTFKDFEVIIADDLCDKSINRKNFAYFKPRQKHKDDAWNLNKAYNDALGLATGELLVFLQDFIWIPANGLQRFWEIYELYPDSIISGCGHKYKADMTTIDEIDERCFADRGITPINFSQWELNWASCPRKLAKLFNEEMDKHYGGENHYFAKATGATMYLDRENECKGLSQELCGGRPELWEIKHYNKICQTS